MDKIKVIKNEKDYEEALKLVETFILSDPDPESDEGERLSLLSSLIEDYETKTFPSTLPNPIDAIKFRMEQANLKPVDLIPFIGSRSRVSEVLSGKRSLTLDMIRALEKGLGIPAKVLINKTNVDVSDYDNWNNSLVKEMGKRGYFGKAIFKKNNKVELLENFFSSISSFSQIIGMQRKSHYRLSPLTDKSALTAWTACVIKKASKVTITEIYKQDVNIDFMQKLLKLSIEDNWELKVQEYLKNSGITLVIEPHFPKTYLDGATILINKENPIIGLTLRYDRLDNFWFTLMHELAHLSLHYNSNVDLFYDEIEDIGSTNVSDIEQGADKLAEEAILPKAKWEISPARLIPSPMAADSLSRELGIHIAIIAGQIRHRGNKYIYLNKLVNEKVRQYFYK